MDDEIIGTSQSIQKIQSLVKKIATTELNTVVAGETGVGKELIVQALYKNSRRCNKPFRKINCAALPESLLESELFGYEKGAFTGANARLRGKFLQADKGILFLDEIGDMPLALQSKLLRVLQDGTFSPLGSEESLKSDVWIISATNKDIKKDIEFGEFRRDLFYRINVVNIHLPPLRKRKEDIPLLIDYYYEIYSRQFRNNNPFELSDSFKDLLCKYHWPGNVRELQNVLKKVAVLGEHSDIIRDELRQTDTETIPTNMPDSIFNVNLRNYTHNNYELLKNADLSLKRIKSKTIDRVDRQIISYVLNHCGWNRVKASKILKISYRALLSRISDLEITVPTEI